MLTRGFYIGEIVDELAAIREQVRMRNQLKMFDLTIVAENFFRDFLNPLLSGAFKNLNEDGRNEVGLDLGCERLSMGVQVTSRADSAKVNETLLKITDEQRAKYKSFVVLVIGQRQTTYTLDKSVTEQHNFDWARDVWDLETLAQKALSLKVDQLAQVHSVVRANVARVKMDLEIPDESGNYATSGYASWEPPVSLRPGTGDHFLAFQRSDPSKEISEGDEKAVREDVKSLGLALSKLPRVTREFLAALLERIEHSRRSTRHNEVYALYEKVRRTYNGDLDGEVRILEHAGLARVDAEDVHERGPAEIVIRLGSEDIFRFGFLEYIEAKNLSVRNVIGNADLSAF